MKKHSARRAEITKTKLAAGAITCLALLGLALASALSNSGPSTPLATQTTPAIKPQRGNRPKDSALPTSSPEPAKASAQAGQRQAQESGAVAQGRRLNKHRFQWRGRVAAPGRPAGKLVWKPTRRRKPESPHGESASISTRGGAAGMPPADQLSEVQALAAGPNGSLYVDDAQNNRVVKISSAGIATVVAGNGFYGQTGDGGPATKAELDNITQIGADASGNLYLTDIDSIRKVNASTGVISRIAGAGNPEFGCSGPEEGEILKTAISPQGVTVTPSGTVYFISGCTNGRLDEISSGGTLNVVAHIQYLGFGIVLEGKGNLLVTGNQGISTVTPGGEVSTFAGNPESFISGSSGDGGPATSAKFSNPQGLAIDEAGNVFVADRGNQRVREIDTEGIIHTFAGTGSYENGDGLPAESTYLTSTYALAFDTNGNLYIGESTSGVYGGLRQVKAVGGAVGPKSQIRDYPLGQDLPGETNGGCNPSEQHGSHGCSGDPVDTLTGQYWQRHTDLSVPGRGFPLKLSRSYSSLGAEEATGPGPLGYGWAFNYGMSLTKDEVSGDITIHQENGSTVLFVPNSAGTAYACDTRVLATLVHNESGTWTFTRKARQKFTFNAEGQLISEKDLNGETTSLSYKEGQLTKVTDPAGRELTLAYNEGGQIKSATEPEGLTVKYEYEEGNLSDVTDIGGGKWHYTYDGAHHLLTEEDPREHILLTNTYDGAGRVETQKDGLNRETTFAYGNGETTVTSPAGNETRDIYEGGLLTKKIEGLGTEDEATWKYAYDPVTLGKTSTTDPNGHTTTMKYNSAGDLTSIKDPLGHETSFEYDALNDRTRVTDAKSTSTTLTYDENGNLTETSTPRGAEHQIWKYAHENGSHPGDVTKVTDPDSHATILGYNTDGDLTSVKDAEGDETTIEYDGIGRRLKVVSPLGNAVEGEPSKHTTSYEDNAFGDVEKIVDPLKGETLFGYDGDRNLTSVTDPDGNETTRVYDNANELSEIKRADTTVLKNGYDEDGNLETQTDGAGKATSYGYDPLDRLESVTDPLSRKTEYAYDAASNLKELIDPLERTTTYGYDEANLLKSIKYSDGITPEATFGYDEDNQRTSMTDGTGSSSFVYNSLHQLTEATQQSTTVRFGYDLANNETSIVYPGGHEVVRAFDKANRLESVTDWSSNKTSFGYDADSDLTSTNFPSGTTNVDKYGYDLADRLASVTMKKGEANLASLAYKRDPMGQLEKEEQTGLPGSASTSFGYTALNQLSSAGSSAYSYSSADNPTKLAGANGYEYNEANELEAIPSAAPGGAAALAYNSLGERTELNPESGPTIEYGYDQAGRLKGVATETHAYGGDGLRLSTTTGESTQHFSWDRTDGVPLLLTDGSTRYIYGPGGLPIEQVSAGGTATYYHHDQLGSTRMLTNSSGEAKGTFSYAPYGALAASSGELTTPLGYAGQYTDPVSGLQYLRARYYDPATGQFVSRDPLNVITRSPYGYVYNNPLTATDPTGQGVLDDIVNTVINPCNPIIGPPSPLCMSSQEAVNTSAGIGDQLLSVPGSGFGPFPRLTAGPWLRHQLGINDVEECSGSYRAGTIAGGLLKGLNTLTNVPSYSESAGEWWTTVSRGLGEKFVHIPPGW